MVGLFILQIGYSQDLSGVVNINDKSAEKLYNASREWFALNYQSSKDVVKLADNTTNVFIVKGEQRETVLIKKIKVRIKMIFTLKLQFKDGRFKYDFNDIDYRNVITNQKIDIDAFEECSTVAGIEEYYKRNGIPKFLEGKKEEEAQRNATNYQIVKSMPSDIIDSLTRFLKNKKSDNW
jgi:hypothetical protein